MLAMSSVAGSATDVRAAVAASYLSDLTEDARSALLAGATRLVVEAGGVLHRDGDATPHVELVLDGLVRVFVTGADGRTLTVRYARRGDLLGVVSLYARSFSLPATIQALTASTILACRPDVVRRLAEHDPAVAQALLTELSERVQSFIAEIALGAFAPVRARLARHLLDLASAAPPGRPSQAGLVTRVTQAQLAAACGTVREVVVRELRELRAAGIVDTGRDAIVILDPDALAAASAGPLDWNTGR